jgi:hypothetical protein
VADTASIIHGLQQLKRDTQRENIMCAIEGDIERERERKRERKKERMRMRMRMRKRRKRERKHSEMTTSELYRQVGRR